MDGVAGSDLRAGRGEWAMGGEVFVPWLRCGCLEYKSCPYGCEIDEPKLSYGLYSVEGMEAVSDDAAASPSHSDGHRDSNDGRVASDSMGGVMEQQCWFP